MRNFKKMMGGVTLAVFSLIGLLVLETPAGATTLSYTDTTQAPGDAITYTLGFSLAAGSTYNATLSISNSANVSPDWYVGWVQIKFDGGASTIASLSPPGGTGPWSIVNGGDATQVLQGSGNYATLQQDGFTGFYVTSLAQGNTPVITEGICVTCAPSTSTFTFTFTVPGSLQNPMPFQVGYYDGTNGAGNIIYNGLSQDLSAVPEPASLLLLGSGLAGLGLWGWKRRREVEA